ncbi:hypothetical protein G6F65_022157 [Rhizopus arrhizus]|nr:hypothetical protein G6F65_022157 [Rhizopus arrhizus]
MNEGNTLPSDLPRALLVGRVWRPGPVNGPSVVVVRNGEVFDITAVTPTVSDLLDRPDRVRRAAPAGPLRSAADQGGRCHVRHQPAGTHDRGRSRRRRQPRG